jgi:hypothetical protein
MPRIIRNDLVPMIGTKWGNWTVLEHDLEKSVKRHTYYKCVCDCGTIKTVRADMLRNGVSKSCGCFKKEQQSQRAKVHGLYQHPLNKRWITMNQRCTNPNVNRYERYGGRGLKVCDEWKNDFLAFYNWSMENGYSSKMTLDRINNDGDYCPENCRYISNKEQQFNKSTNHYVEIEGVSKTIYEWCEEYGVNRNLFNWRLRYGWTGKKLLQKSSKQ